ncbi:MAG: RHS repeat-associated core domain-containing protein, partial [Ruminococcaceae bacterium]|nr:RHS repeat-associated core domain-containing protein [Oscillospiraceae bacterium]
GVDYYFLKNLQGDIIEILNSNGQSVVQYAYDAWGKVISVTGAMKDSVGQYNPFRYRGYYYDTETGFYYLNSRYYDPEVCRFVNADGYVSTGQGIIGNNMFAYCNNNPVNMIDNVGTWPCWNDIKAGFGKAIDFVDDNIFQPVVDFVDDNVVQPVAGFIDDVVEDFNNYDSNNQSEEKVLASNYFSSYKGVFVIRTNGDRSGSFGAIFLTRETNNRSNPEDVLRHEYGHTKQLEEIGVVNYALYIGLPSWQQWGTGEYYSKPWEITADIYGGVQSRQHSQSDIYRGFAYLEVSKRLNYVVWEFVK